MRVDFGRLRSCLYMRSTSPAALLTNKSTSSSARTAARHSLKKCPDPVSAQPQRGVLTLAIVTRFCRYGMQLTQIDAGADQFPVAEGDGALRTPGRTADGAFRTDTAQETRKTHTANSPRHEIYRPQ